MRIIQDYPPNYTDILNKFDLEGKKLVFTWGEIIYNPHNCNLADHLIVHEKVHSKQQVIPETWWDKYLNDGEFRLNQEVEAYRRQYKFAKNFIKDRNILYKFLVALASDLASGMYKLNLTTEQAINKIK